MTQKTMTEKDAYLAAFEREFQITKKVLNAYPAAQCELKPSDKGKNARELAWMLVLNQMVVQPTLTGELKPGGLPQAPQTWNEVIAAFDKAHTETTNKLKTVTEEQVNRTIQMPLGPQKMGEMPIMEALWFFLNDTIHHRGQLTVYLRIAGGKLPSIYGPSADEPWF